MSKCTVSFGRFKNRDDAVKILQSVKKLAGLYNVVTFADVADLCGYDSTWNDHLIGWSSDALTNYPWIRQINSIPEYTIQFPECDWDNSNPPDKYQNQCMDHSDIQDMSDPEPINITISSGEWDTRRNDIDDVFQALFNNLDKVKDRPVFITIM